MKLLKPIGELHCPECKMALVLVNGSKTRVVYSHGGRSPDEEPEYREGMKRYLCPNSGKLFTVEPQTIEAIEI